MTARPPCWGVALLVLGVLISAVLVALLGFCMLNPKQLTAVATPTPSMVPKQYNMSTYFSIVSEASGLVLDISQGTMTPGRPVLMFPSHGFQHQIWSHNIDTGTVHSKKNTSFVLEVLDIEGNPLVINLYTEGRHTQRYGLGPKHIYLLHDIYKVLSVTKSRRARYAPVGLDTFSGASNQCWKYKGV